MRNKYIEAAQFGLDVAKQPVVGEDISTLTTEEWKKIRLKGIGGSEAYAASGIEPIMFGMDRRKLWLKKKGLLPEEDITPEKQWRFDIGHASEAPNALYFQAKSSTPDNQLRFKVVKDNHMFYHPVYPFMFADPDYFVFGTSLAGDFAGQKGYLEIKTSSNPAVWHSGILGEGARCPVNYEMQCRHSMAVYNVDYAILFATFGFDVSNACVVYIRRDYEKEADLIKREQEFWAYVLKNQEPSPAVFDPAVYVPAEKSASEHEFGSEADSYIAQWMTLEKQRKDYKALTSQLEKQQDEIKQWFLDQMGSSEKGKAAFDGTEYIVSAKEYTSESVDKVKLAADYPEAYDECVSPNQKKARRFSIKEVKKKE